MEVGLMDRFHERLSRLFGANPGHGNRKNVIETEKRRQLKRYCQQFWGFHGTVVLTAGARHFVPGADRIKTDFPRNWSGIAAI